MLRLRAPHALAALRKARRRRPGGWVQNEVAAAGAVEEVGLHRGRTADVPGLGDELIDKVARLDHLERAVVRLPPRPYEPLEAGGVEGDTLRSANDLEDSGELRLGGVVDRDPEPAPRTCVSGGGRAGETGLPM